MKRRGFEVVTEQFRKFPEEIPIIPERGTNKSAAYDFHSLEDKALEPGEMYHFYTDIKAYMMHNEILIINVRSSMGVKHGCRLKNTQGWIDADYYGNETNDGQIGIYLENTTDEIVYIQKGDRIAQGMFTIYLLADNDKPRSEQRIGGVGSTGR